MTRIQILAACVIGLSLNNPIGAQETGKLSGRVIDSQGDAVADASVVLVADVESKDLLATQSNVNGEFVLEPKELIASYEYSIVAWKPGYCVGTFQERTADGDRPDGAIPSASGISITLSASVPFTFQIVKSDGKPLINEEIELATISAPDFSLFFPMVSIPIDSLTRTTDADGMLTLDYVPESATAALRIPTDEHGDQIAIVSSQRVAVSPTLKLMPTGQINISLIGDESTDVANREISVYARVPTKDEDVSEGEAAQSDEVPRVSYGTSVLTTDKNGSAKGIVIAGNTRAYINPRPEDKSFVVTSTANPMEVKPGQTLNCSLEFKPGIRLHGHIVDPKGNPIKGVGIDVTYHSLVTDNEGSYECTVPASDMTSAGIRFLPDGYVMPFQQHFDLSHPSHAESKSESEQPDIVLNCAANVSGTILNEQGMPVAGASITAAWRAKNSTMSTLRSDMTKSDLNGHFRFQHVQGGVKVIISAQTDESASEEVTSSIPSSDDRETEIELIVRKSGNLNIVGTVQGSDGRRIANANIRIQQALLVPDGGIYSQRTLRWNGRDAITANDDGSFSTPTKVRRSGQYSVTASAPGYLTHETTYLTPPDDGDFDLRALVLARARSVTGIVVDSAGEPLSQATVSAYSAELSRYRGESQRIVATTDERGVFSLDGLHPQAAMLLVEKNGYRISGSPLLIDKPSVTLTLYRTDEALGEEHRVRVSQLSDDRHAAALRLISGLPDKRRSSSYYHGQILEMLLRIDPSAAIEELEQSTSASVRASTLAKLREFEDAFAEVTGIDDPYSRCNTRINVIEQCDDKELARTELANTLVDAESIRRPDRQLVIIGSVADAFASIGDTERAEAILRRHVADAEALSKHEWPGFARLTFAERIAPFDFELALKMVDEAEADDHERHLRNIAHRLADVDPDASERALQRIASARFSDSPVVRVAYRMAKVDMARALRLLENIDSGQRRATKPQALGVVAVAIRETDIGRSRELLKEAFNAIPINAPDRSKTFGTAITLLRYAETIDPDNLTDYFWHTVRLRKGPNVRDRDPSQLAEENAEQQSYLGLLSVLYDQPVELTQQIMEPVFAYWDQRLDSELTSSFTSCKATFVAMALANPNRAVDWALRFEGGVDETNGRYIPQPWEVIGKALTQDRNEIGQYITEEVFHHWVIDKYDL